MLRAKCLDGVNACFKGQSRPIIEPIEQRLLMTASPYESRGWVSLVVDQTVAASLAPKLEQFRRDLIGDGWRIAPDQPNQIGHSDAPRMNDDTYIWDNDFDTPTESLARTLGTPNFNLSSGDVEDYLEDLDAIKDMIAADAAAATLAGSELKQIILVGHPTEN